jgi:hypothetical protein
MRDQGEPSPSGRAKSQVPTSVKQKGSEFWFGAQKHREELWLGNVIWKTVLYGQQALSQESVDHRGEGAEA